MRTNYEIRYAAHPEDAKNYDTARIRRDFLIENVFVADEVNMVYSMYDRMHPYYQSAYNLAGTKYDTENDDGYYFPLLPYEDTLSGIVIDYDLYSQLCKDYGLDSEMTGYLFEGDDVRMPGTWDEFFELLTTIRDQADGTYSGFTYAIDYYTPSLQNAVITSLLFLFCARSVTLR